MGLLSKKELLEILDKIKIRKISIDVEESQVTENQSVKIKVIGVVDQTDLSTALDSSAVSGTPTSKEDRYILIEKIIKYMYMNNSGNPVKIEDVLKEIIAKGISEQDAKKDLEIIITRWILQSPRDAKQIQLS